MKETDLPHSSILHHITGKSVYVNDIPMPDNGLYALPFISEKAHANIVSVNCYQARKLKGVVAILSFQDIPGENQMGPVINDEFCLAENKVEFIGQAIALIAAETKEIALQAAKLIEIEYEELPAIINVRQAMNNGELLSDARKIERGNIEKSLQESVHTFEGEFYSNGQEHWYLETQSTLCIPQEGKEIKIYCSTQHPSETQAIVAQVLGLPRHLLEVEVKRLGGAFGGKETQANHIAVWTALLAQYTGQAVKMHLSREMDQLITGKRHAFLSEYKVGFDSKGKINALDVILNAEGGAALDLSMAIVARAMFHIDNAYYIPHLKVLGKAWKTHQPPNTAFRGFGAPQAVAVIENIIDKIARFLKKDALEIRQRNFYSLENNTTHYGQKIEQNPMSNMLDDILESSKYIQRKKEIGAFNKDSHWIKKGIALVPVKFGISFTLAFLNQAGALVNIYQDGSVIVNHGGIEMGQGLHTKIKQIAALTLGVKAECIIISPTNTSKIPNTSATAASSGTDLNGKAVENACLILKDRLAKVFKEKYGKENENLIFENGMVSSDEYNISFKKLCSLAYTQQISLSSTGYYRTPNLYFDKKKGQGKPFHYFTYGFAVSEVEIDIFTGKHKLLRTDILHDVGESINATLDIGQIEGAFVQGLGWVTTEELKYDTGGRLLTISPDTYKIPCIDDIPLDFRVELSHHSSQENNIKKSKAVGEPPFIHALSVWLAIKEAISAVAHHKKEPELSIPATQEAILLSIEKIKKPARTDLSASP